MPEMRASPTAAGRVPRPEDGTTCAGTASPTPADSVRRPCAPSPSPSTGCPVRLGCRLGGGSVLLDHAAVDTWEPWPPAAGACRRKGAEIVRIRRPARETASSARFAAFPDDAPTLPEVAERRVSRADHPAAAEPGLVEEVGAELEHRRPGWARAAHDESVEDDGVARVEPFAAGVGRHRA